MSKIIAIANQKGGVGKTTTTVNIAAGLVQQGYKVLCIDLDPQANMSDYLGFQPDGKSTLSTLMQLAATMQPFTVESTIRHNAEGIAYIPSDIILASADVFLATAMCREKILHRILSDTCLADFEYILIDCLPSLGILLTNALAAADTVIIPVQAQKYGYVGLSQLQQVISLVQQQLNPKLTVTGIVVTMVDTTNMSKLVEETLQEEHETLLFTTRIHRRVEASNSTLAQKSMVSYANSHLGKEYKQLVQEIVERGCV